MRLSSTYGGLKSAIRKVLCMITSNSYSPARLPLLAASRLGLVPKALWRRLPVERTFHVVLPDESTSRYATVPYDFVGLALYWRGVNSWEAETIPIFSKIAARSTLVLDIGANTGAYTLIAGAANSQSRILSFEPVPEIYNRLVSNVQLNGLGLTFPWFHGSSAHCVESRPF